jgi:hypothetical protein
MPACNYGAANPRQVGAVQVVHLCLPQQLWTSGRHLLAGHELLNARLCLERVP